MTTQQFFDKYGGQKVDFDGWYGAQCMDLVEKYNAEVVGAPRIGGNAIDAWDRYSQAHYTRIANTPTGVPQKGDIMIWGTGVGQYGHIAIVVDANVNSFRSLDQNWPFSNGTTPSKVITHNYTSVLGWLRPKKDVNFDQVAYEQEQALIRAEQEAKRIQEEAERLAKAEAERKEAERIAKEQARLEEEARQAKELADKLEKERLEVLRKAEEEKMVQDTINKEKTKQEALNELKEANMSILQRLKSPVVLTAILGQVLLLVGLFMPQLSDEVKIVGTTIIELLTLVGVLNNPTDSKNF